MSVTVDQDPTIIQVDNSASNIEVQSSTQLTIDNSSTIVNVDSDTIEIEVSNASMAGTGVNPLFTLYVDKSGDDISAGSITEPMLTIQAAIDKATEDFRIAIGPGTYTEDLFFDKDRITIEAAYNSTSSYLVSITGQHTWGAGTTRVRFKGLQLNDGGVASSIIFDMTGGAGRTFADNLTFNVTGSVGRSVVHDSGNNFNVWRDCAFSGQYVQAGGSNFMIQGDGSGEILMSAGNLTILNALSMPYVTHSAGGLTIEGSGSMARDGSSRSINSTATDVAANFVNMHNVDLFNGTDYGVISIANCAFVLDSVTRDPLQDTLPANKRTSRGLHQADIKGSKFLETQVFS